MDHDDKAALAREIAGRRDWGAIDTDALARRYWDTAIASMCELLDQVQPTTFRAGVRAAVQAAVDDLSALVKRRNQAQANEAHTAVIVGIARRLATLPMPPTEDDTQPAPPRAVLVAKVAKMLWPQLPWNDPAHVMEGIREDRPTFVAPPDSNIAALMEQAWVTAEEIVTLVRYA